MLPVSCDYHVLDGGGVRVHAPLVQAAHALAILAKVPQLKGGEKQCKWHRVYSRRQPMREGGRDITCNVRMYCRTLKQFYEQLHYAKCDSSRTRPSSVGKVQVGLPPYVRDTLASELHQD